jgi:hypothetical protein
MNQAEKSIVLAVSMDHGLPHAAARAGSATGCELRAIVSDPNLTNVLQGMGFANC